MQLRDVYNINPGSFEFRYVSPASVRPTPETKPDLFKWDYKTPYKHSIFYQRKLQPISPEISRLTNFAPSSNAVERIKDNTPQLAAAFGMSEQIAEIPNPKVNIQATKEYFRRVVFDGLSYEALQGLNAHILPFYKKLSQEETHIVIVDDMGTDKGVDLFDNLPIWQELYFNSTQMVWDKDDELREFHDYQMPVYVGRTKYWQNVPDYFGRDQVDIIQASIGAPVQEQLDLWEEENDRKTIPMPISNENQAKFRDVPEHFENLDHDYERIIYERQRNQAFEKMRNSRYWDIARQYREEMHGHEHH